MKMFMVTKGTQLHAHNNATATAAPDYSTEIRFAKRDLAFNLEDVVIDPVGSVGCHRGNGNVIGGAWARAGFYGFTWGTWTLLVPAVHVEVI